VPVEVGMYSDRLIEIKSGLKEGDMVMLSALSSSDNIDMTGSIVDAEKAGTNRTSSRKTNATTEAARLRQSDKTSAKVLTTAAAPGATNRPVWIDLKRTNNVAPVSASVPPTNPDRK
jgi:hypothetical protein